MLNLTSISPISLLAQTAGAGEGIQYSLEPAWSWAPWLTLLIVIALTAYVVALYVMERGRAPLVLRLCLAGGRLLLIGIVLVMLFGWMLHRDRTDLPDVVVVIDDSASMLFADQYDDAPLNEALAKRVRAAGFDQSTRLNLAKTLLLEDDGNLLDELRQKYNLKVYRLGGSARAETADAELLESAVRDLTADEQVSRLGNGLREILEAQRGRPTAAVILLTDGVTTEGKSIGEVADYARRKSIPLYAVGLGNDKPPRDVRLSDLLVDDTVFVNDIVTFELKATGVGYAGEQDVVRLKQQGNNRVLAEQKLLIGKDGVATTVRLTYRPTKKGDFQYVVEIDPLNGEANTENNRLARQISVRDETIHVLLVQSQPSFEFRYLKTLLGRQVKSGQAGAEQSIELTCVLQQADDDYVKADKTVRRLFPVRREELFEYDVVIFGDVNPAGLGRLERDNLADFVKVRGGGLVVIAGPRYTPLAYRDTPLADLFPVDLTSAAAPDPNQVLTQKFSIQPTTLGMSSPQMQLGDTPAESMRIWSHLDGVYWLLETPDLKPAARVLAEHPTRTGRTGRNLPVITMQYVGAGKVIFHATDETHRWRFRTGDKYFGRYWIQTIRYLSRSKLLGQNRTAELISDRDEYQRGDAVLLRLRFFDDRLAPAQDDGVTVVLERDQGERRSITLRRDSLNRGTFTATVTNLADGDYRAWVASPTLENKAQPGATDNANSTGGPPFHRFTIVPPPGEQARLEMDSADLKLAAQKTQGHFYTLHDVDDLRDDLPRGRQVRIASLPPVSIWSWWPIPLAFGALFVALITIEWLLRKRLGML